MWNGTGGNPFGLPGPEELVRHAFNRTGAATTLGQLVMFDCALVDDESVTMDFGAEDSGLSNMTAPTTAGLVHGFFGIVMDAVADDKKMRVMVRGVIRADLNDAYGTLNGMQTFSAVDGQDSLEFTTQGAGNRVLARPLSIKDSAGQVAVLFDGLGSLGVV
ncbi:MAG: hypothetical protein DRR04_11650 [Gammaproteobacteria bacterium]|nr:MAG: hypothetical protein DRR04_11650 [Gammaproteobacteria bacterium]